MRDLLGVLGIERATVVGHSFGGGVAMQFAYQFPERTERVVLEASGGLGPEVRLSMARVGSRTALPAAPEAPMAALPKTTGAPLKVSVNVTSPEGVATPCAG